MLKKSCEQWQPIHNFESLYDISNFGEVRTYRKQVRGRSVICREPQAIMATQKDTNGYPTIGLRKNGMH